MTENKKNPLGRLSVFGIKHPWQACFLAPRRYVALDDIVTDTASLAPGMPIDALPDEGIERHVVMTGKVAFAADYDPIKKRTRLGVRLADGALCNVMAFGHPNQYPGGWHRQGSDIHLMGKLIAKPDGFTMMFAPQPVPPEFIGRAMGIYPGKTRTIKPDTTRERVLAQLTDENLSEAIEALKQALSPHDIGDVLAQWGEQHGYRGMTEDSLVRALRCLHHPKTVAQGELSKALFQDLSAMSMLLQADNERPRTGIFQRVVIDDSKLQQRIETMSFTPTGEQRDAVHDMLSDMSSGNLSHRLLSGDVGTGKTTVFALLAAALHDIGGKTAIMLPSEDMVNQVAAEMQAWWPDMAIDKVTGQTPKEALLSANVRLGTTALIHRHARDAWHPTLTVVDEQQKYSTEQRHALVEQGGHLLECTATCLPRTMAQMQFGLLPVSRLTQPHTPKDIATSQWDTQDRPTMHGLFGDVKETLAGGEQVLVIFAARDAKDADALLALTQEEHGEGEAPSSGAGAQQKEKPTPPTILSLEEGIARWRNVLGDDAVVGLHGKMKASDRKASLAALNEGRAQVLCATSAAEVGLNLPQLRQVVIHNPERFGLVTLHQIRGRVARNGGWGRCDLLTQAQNLSEKAVERLNAFINTQDGFALADQDMQQRGMGSLMISASRQSGETDAGLLFGERPALENFENARNLLEGLTDSAKCLSTISPASLAFSPVKR